MFEKLMTLLLHGKGALVAGVLVAGTAGVAISGTMNGADFNLTVTPAASPATNTAATPTPSPLTNGGVVLSPSQPTNGTSTSGETASNCSEAAHARNAAMLAARVVWTEGRAALALLVEAADKAKGEDKKNVESFRKGIDQARHDALKAIQHEWQTNVACAGKGQDSDDEDSDEDSTSTATPTATNTVNAPATTTPTPTPTPTSNTTTGTTGTTTTGTDANTVEVKFDTSKLDTHYAKFVDDEVTAINQVLSDAATALSSTDASSKKDEVKKAHDKKSHDKKSKHEPSKHSEHDEGDDD